MRLLVALVLLVLAGCGAGDRVAPTVPAPAVVAPMTHAEPVKLLLDAIDVSSPLAPLGLNTDGTVEVPPLDTPMLAGGTATGRCRARRDPR